MKADASLVALAEEGGRIRMLLDMLLREECSPEYVRKRLAEIDAENEANPNG